MAYQLDASAYSNPDVLGTFQATLGNVGVPSDQVVAAQNAYSILPQSAQNAVSDVLNAWDKIPPGAAKAGGDIISGALHGGVSINSVMPLVSLGLAASGVGAPVAGLVAAAFPIAESIGQALGLFGSPGPPMECNWVVQSAKNPNDADLAGGPQQMGWACFVGKRPFGQGDPNWIKWADFLKAWKNSGTNSPGGIQFFWNVSNPPKTMPVKAYGDDPRETLGDAFPEWPEIRKNLEDLANAGSKGYKSQTDLATAPQAVRDFAKLYFFIWQANAERAINGHKFASSANLLTAALQAWNTHHGGTQTVGVGPKANGWFVERLLNGDIDGQDKPSFQIPTTAMVPPPITHPIKHLAFHLGKIAQAAPVKHIAFNLGGHLDAPVTVAKVPVTLQQAKVVQVQTSKTDNALLYGAGGGILGFLVGGPPGAAAGAALGAAIGAKF